MKVCETLKGNIDIRVQCIASDIIK